MLKPNTTVASMAAYALPDINAAGGVEAIVLAQNEHVFPPSAAVQQAVSEAIASGQLYPDNDWDDLREAIATVHELDAGRIVCGAGSMELMSSLMLASSGLTLSGLPAVTTAGALVESMRDLGAARGALR